MKQTLHNDDVEWLRTVVAHGGTHGVVHLGARGTRAVQQLLDVLDGMAEALDASDDALDEAPSPSVAEMLDDENRIGLVLGCLAGLHDAVESHSPVVRTLIRDAIAIIADVAGRRHPSLSVS